jgi:ABC-type sugar transport system permease subunit
VLNKAWGWPNFLQNCHQDWGCSQFVAWAIACVDFVNQSFTEYSTTTLLETYHSYKMTNDMKNMTKYSHFKLFNTHVFREFFFFFVSRTLTVFERHLLGKSVILCSFTRIHLSIVTSECVKYERLIQCLVLIPSVVSVYRMGLCFAYMWHTSVKYLSLKRQPLQRELPGIETQKNLLHWRRELFTFRNSPVHCMG